MNKELDDGAEGMQLRRSDRRRSADQLGWIRTGVNAEIGSEEVLAGYTSIQPENHGLLSKLFVCDSDDWDDNHFRNL